jgi:hypothetical protein
MNQVEQNMAMAMNAISMKAKLEKEAEESKKEKVPNFFDRERQRKFDDPNNSAYENAKALGKADAIAFLNSATSEHHLQHKASFARFRDEFGLDARKVEDYFVAKKCEEKKAFPFDLQDPTYINTLKAKYKPTGNVTREKMKLYDNFCNALDEKHSRVGTRGDAEWVKNYTSNYCLQPNDQVLNLREFQPMP